jgi:hypothetical protein
MTIEKDLTALANRIAREGARPDFREYEIAGDAVYFYDAHGNPSGMMSRQTFDAYRELAGITVGEPAVVAYRWTFGERNERSPNRKERRAMRSRT